MQASCNSEAQFVVALCIYVFIMNPRHVTTFALSFGSTCEEVKGLLPDLHIYLGIKFFPIGVKGITRGTQAAEKGPRKPPTEVGNVKSGPRKPPK
jgi:hypothetical protein